MSEGAQSMSEVYALGEYETLASMQYKSATSGEAKQANIELLQFMQEMETSHKRLNQKSIDGDRGFVYMRLALLEQRAGNLDSSRAYIQQAQASFAKRGDKAFSPEKELQGMAKFDATSHYLLPFMLEARRMSK